MATNDFLPFCPTDTGTNLLTQSDYAAAANRTDGNQPGVASSKLNNKALRQGTFIASQLAQLVANLTGANVVDDGNTAEFLSQLTGSLGPVAPNVQRFTSTGSNTWNMPYQFFIVTGSATIGATYTNNSVTFTVLATVASGTTIRMTGNGDPLVSGTLTKTSGTGDATLSFFIARKPNYLDVIVVGAGGGGSGSGSGSVGTGGAGASTTFGSILTAAGGSGAAPIPGVGAGGATGGAPTVNTGGIAVVSITGGAGISGGSGSVGGGAGGVTALGGSGVGAGAAGGNNGGAGVANTGGGGGGGAGDTGISSGNGGGAGAYIQAHIPTPASTYAISVGTGGTAGTLGTSGHAGGAGGTGYAVVVSVFL